MSSFAPKMLSATLPLLFFCFGAVAAAKVPKTRSSAQKPAGALPGPAATSRPTKTSPRAPLLAAKENASPAAGVGSTTGNPFAQLKVVVPRDKLPPLKTVRLQDRREGRSTAQKERIKVSIKSVPGGATVRWGAAVLGKTPLSVTAKPGSTPMDLVLRRKGYMTLRTRVQRRISRTYTFKLTPAKFR